MFKHIRIKILFFIIPVLFLAVLLSYIASINTANRIINNEINERISAEKEIQKTEIETNINNAKQICGDLGAFVENTYPYDSLYNYENMLQSIVKDNAFIYGSGIWFEPYSYEKSEKYVGPYAYRTKDTVKLTYNYSTASYDYFKQGYYTEAKKENRTIFTDMYYDQTSGLYMLTCAKPIHDKKGTYLGCISVDIELSSMQKLVKEYSEKYDGTTYIVSKKGVYLASENDTLVKDRSSLYISGNQSYREAVTRIFSENSGKTFYYQKNKKVNIYFDTLNDLGWKIIFEIPETSIEGPLHQLSTSFLIIFGLTLVLAVITIFMMTAKNIGQPVRELLREFRGISENEFDPEKGNELEKRKDEFGQIGNALHSMKQQLKTYQEELETSLEENVASQEELIQQNDALVESEAQLLNSLQYSKSLMEAIPDTVFVLSIEGVFLDRIGYQGNLFVKKDDFIGKKLTEIMPENIASEAMKIIRSVIDTGETQKMEYGWTESGMTDYHELRAVKWYDDKIIAIARNITDTHNYIQEIERISFFDQVTGLNNRRYFDQKSQGLNVPENYPVSVIFSDLNGLKVVNDSFGHEYGDLMLKQYASILDASRKENALICRVGGDEFAIILPHTSEEEVKKYIDLLIRRCGDERINGIKLSVAFGYQMIQDSTLSVQRAMKLAEDQMYQNKLFEASSRRSKTIDVVLSTLHEKNPREALHSRRVAEICVVMAQTMKMSASEIKKMRTAGLLHDIGKIGVREELLNKPGKLTPEEYTEICRHPEIGYRILNTAPNMLEISEIILSHHERWDGNGYPQGLAGNEIPLFSRIITIADAFDAMTSDRSYRKAMTSEYALDELKNGAGKQFDPELIEVFLQAWNQGQLNNL